MKKEGRHIRVAKRQIEPRSARLPKARILKPHPRKGTEKGHNYRVIYDYRDTWLWKIRLTSIYVKE